MPEKVSAFIVCCNEEQRIRHCLDSLRWCDEIVIVDSGSSDRTLEICREYTDKIFERAWPGFVLQKRFALEHCTHAWVLNIDADEEVSPELAQRIQSILQTSEGSPIDGYSILRVVYFLGRWWRKGGWYPEYRLRLCRKAKTTWGGEDPHEKAIVAGATQNLSEELYHYTYANFAAQVRSLNSLSSSSAETLFRKGKRVGLISLLARPALRFVKFYLLKKGYREGLPGLIVALYESAYVFMKYSKLWELHHKEQREAGDAK